MLANDLNKARELFYHQLPLLDFILKGGLPATIKAGLRETGLEVGDPRLPVFPLDEAGISQLQGLLNALR
ncbi:4-hydroxy-tetrahydrodipicolinate synthase [compost metagenome]